MSATLQTLLTLDRELVARDFRPLTPWWAAEAERFYASGARNWIARVGRSGTKSTTLVKIAMNETLFGDWDVPPGELHFMPIVSENMDEARNRLRLIASMLERLGINHHPTANMVELEDVPLGFKVFACRIGGVSGFRAFGRCADEVAKWEDEGADPSQEVWSSMAAMTAPHKQARSLAFSSPWAEYGLHHELVTLGDTDTQIVSIAPTWIANPEISEEDTHLLEPNPRIWRREYAAIPQSDVASVFEAELVDLAMRSQRGDYQTESSPVLIIDASRGGDPWAYGFARWSWRHGPKLRVFEIGQVPDAKDTEASVVWLAAKAKELGVTQCVGDQYEAGALSVLFARAGLAFQYVTWGMNTKRNAVDRIDRWLRDGTLELVADPVLRTQLLQYSEKLLRSGGARYEGSGQHDDRAQVLLTLAMADVARMVPPAKEPKEPEKRDPKAMYMRERAKKQEEPWWRKWHK